MAEQTNLFDLVERAAARRAVPRFELWQAASRAIVENVLVAENLSERPNGSATTFRGWFGGFRASVDRHNDPSACAHILRHIIVSETNFDRWLRKWLRKTENGKRGPPQETTGYKEADRKLFPTISRMIKNHEVRSAYDAACQLVDAKKVIGKGTRENKAKRLSTLYLKERDNRR